MAPPKNRPKSGAPPKSLQTKAPSWEKYLNRQYLKKLVFDPHYITPTLCLLFIIEIILNIFIIEKVKYTEIDWKAYMQEVEGVVNGTLDYQLLKGDTGPLVYPAGFVYVYTVLYYVTSRGANVHVAQYVFLALYLTQTLLTYRIYKKTLKIPPYAIVVATLTSYRIHSIYVLRLFNDPVAVLLFYASLNLFLAGKWKLGSLFYSLAVSIKMNILLYAPCLLIAYLTNLTLTETLVNLVICGAVQLVLGAPFLYANPYSYLKGSFDLGRVFEHKWTVNYRFLPRHLFEHPYLHVALLLLHIAVLVAFTPALKRFLTSYGKLSAITAQVKTQLKTERKRRRAEEDAMTAGQKEFLEQYENQVSGGQKNGSNFEEQSLKLEDQMSKISQLFVLPFFVTNLIGVACCRSLHYQFYSWYFHSLLYLGFSTKFPKPLVFLTLGLIEYSWNTYPSTELSSLILHICHIMLIVGVYKQMTA